MIRLQRRIHRLVWIFLLPLLLAILIAAVTTRHRPATAPESLVRESAR